MTKSAKKQRGKSSLGMSLKRTALVVFGGMILLGGHATIAAPAFAQAPAAQPAPPPPAPEVRQVKLTEKHVTGFLGAQKDLVAITAKLEAAGDTTISTGISVGINDNAFPKAETLTVRVFGVAVHSEAFRHDKEDLARGTGGWHGTIQVWALGFTVLFGLLGAAVVIAGLEMKNRQVQGVAEPGAAADGGGWSFSMRRYLSRPRRG